MLRSEAVWPPRPKIALLVEMLPSPTKAAFSRSDPRLADLLGAYEGLCRKIIEVVARDMGQDSPPFSTWMGTWTKQQILLRIEAARKNTEGVRSKILEPAFGASNRGDAVIKLRYGPRHHLR